MDQAYKTIKKAQKVRKYAKTAYQKVPKQKLATKAVAYGAKQLVGGTYFDLASLIWAKSQKKVLKYVGKYAYKELLKSKLARHQLNVIPISLASLVLRSIVNFLIFSRLKLGIYWLDFLISMIVTVIITLLSPVFYVSIQSHEELFMSYTNNFMDNFMGPKGWEYIENIKNRLLLIGGLFLLVMLQLVEVNSWMLQELIIHTLITGYISDRIFQYLNAAPHRLYYAIENFPVKCHYVLTPDSMQRVPKERAHTKNLVFRHMKGQRATLIKI